MRLGLLPKDSGPEGQAMTRLLLLAACAGYEHPRTYWGEYCRPPLLGLVEGDIGMAAKKARIKKPGIWTRDDWKPGRKVNLRRRRGDR